MVSGEASRIGCAVLAAVLWLGTGAYAGAAPALPADGSLRLSDGQEEGERELEGDEEAREQGVQEAPQRTDAGDETDVGDADGDIGKVGNDAQPAPRQRSPDIFTPSEDISEDFAVPFPVDI